MSKQRRAVLNYRPEFSGTIEGYVTNFLKRHYWRVASTMEYDDVFQEAYIVFLRLSRKYSVLEPKQFMALFKRSWENEFNDFATSDGKIRTTLCFDQGEETSEHQELENSIIGDLDNNGQLHTMLRQSPSEVREVLSLFLEAPLELLSLLQDSWKASGRNNDSGNRIINRALGREAEVDSIGVVKAYFL